MITRTPGIQRLKYKTKPALTAVLTPQQQIDQLRMAVAALEERHDAMVEALKSDLAHADVAVNEGTAQIAVAENKQHQREIVSYSEGYRDAIKEVLRLAKRGLS